MPLLTGSLGPGESSRNGASPTSGPNPGVGGSNALVVSPLAEVRSKGGEVDLARIDVPPLFGVSDCAEGGLRGGPTSKRATKLVASGRPLSCGKERGTRLSDLLRRPSGRVGSGTALPVSTILVDVGVGKRSAKDCTGVVGGADCQGVGGAATSLLILTETTSSATRVGGGATALAEAGALGCGAPDSRPLAGRRTSPGCRPPPEGADRVEW